MRRLKPLPKRIPRFSSYEAEASFWDTHDTSRLFKDRKPAHIQIVKPVKHLISIRMDRTLLHGLETLAAKRHMPYQTLIRTLLAEKLREIHKKSA